MFPNFLSKLTQIFNVHKVLKSMQPKLPLTGDILKNIVPNLTKERADFLSILLVTSCSAYGISNADLFHEFISNIAHETGGFKTYQENLNYSATRLLQVFPKYFNQARAKEYAHNKQRIGNRVYANRMGNRDESSGDGYRFRGGGGLQLTGATIYQKYYDYKQPPGLTLPETCDLIRTSDMWAIDSACWVFSIEKKLLPLADADEFLTLVKRINGGTNGLRDRQYYYERAKKYFPI